MYSLVSIISALSVRSKNKGNKIPENWVLYWSINIHLLSLLFHVEKIKVYVNAISKGKEYAGCYYSKAQIC